MSCFASAAAARIDIRKNHPVGRNFELKARLSSLEFGHRVAREIGAERHDAERQRDTYFRVPQGRLKLRQRWRLDEPSSATCNALDSTVGTLPSQLIWYHRPDEARARASDYALVALPSGDDPRDLLAGALGVTQEVIKRRSVYLHDNVRIHLDDVQGLGTFLEFEAIVDDQCDDDTAQTKLERLRALFRIDPGQVLSHSYSDLTRT